MKPNYFLICDIESTHINVASAEIITAAIILADINLQIIDKKSFEMAPTYWKKEHDVAAKIHGISMETAMRFPNKKNQLLNLFDWIKDKSFYFSGHFNRMNGVSYDYALLKQEFLDIGSDYYFKFTQFCDRKNICSTHSLANAAVKAGKISVPLTIKEGNKKASRDLSLKNLCKIMNIKLDNHHEAMADCIASYELMKKFSKEIDLFEVIENDWR